MSELKMRQLIIARKDLNMAPKIGSSGQPCVYGVPDDEAAQ